MTKASTTDLHPGYSRGKQVLEAISWTPMPDAMFRAPSLAKGKPLIETCEQIAEASGGEVDEIMDDAVVASRLDHLIAVGGDSARSFLLSDDCKLTRKQIATLCRRMPPFIAAKLRELSAGGTNIDSNPTGAFDTNGWSELRVRLPKFRSSLQHYAKQRKIGKVPDDVRSKALSLATYITTESDELLALIRTFEPVGVGKSREVIPLPVQVLDWMKAPMKLAQALGVLRKTNRDIRSPHWKKEWVPTHADYQVVSGDVIAIRAAAISIAHSA